MLSWHLLVPSISCSSLFNTWDISSPVKVKVYLTANLSVTGRVGIPYIQYTLLTGTIESLTGNVQRLVSAKEELNKEVNS